MLRLRVIETGSKGNTYLLTDETDNTLILDAGVKADRVFASIERSETVCGCLVTHEHGDHSRAVFDLAIRGVRVAMSQGTLNAIQGASQAVGMEIVQERQQYVYGVYKVMPFAVQHDAAEPYGFLIEHMPTGDVVLYATDTYYLRYRFPKVAYWVIECNYVDELAQETDRVLRHRLMTSHMSLKRLKQTLAENDLSETYRIVLVHLSDSRSAEQVMVREIQEQTGIETIPAQDGMTITLEHEPF